MAEIRWINKNKSCIEMFLKEKVYFCTPQINKNKSCIEMGLE